MSRVVHGQIEVEDVTAVFRPAPPATRRMRPAPRPQSRRPIPPPRRATGTPLPRQAPTPPPAPTTPPPAPAPAPAPATVDDGAQLLSLVRRIALQADLDSTLKVLERGIVELVGASRVHCLIADPLTGTPWAAGGSDTSLAGLAAAHKQQLAAQPVRRCPNWCHAVDDPDGTGDEAVMAQPLGAAGVVAAVVMIVRDPSAPVFGQRESMLLATLAQQIGALLMSAVQAAAQRSSASAGNPLFRDQALDRHRESRRDGALLNLSPRWISRVYPAVLLGFAVALGYGLLAEVSQYSSGPAVVKIEGTEVTARAGGTVVASEVVPGQRVEEGDLLVKLHSDAEAAELGEITLEYQRQLGTFLFDPSNQSAKSSLATIAARKHKAEKVLATREVRAPRAGIVSDLRAIIGKRLEAGDYIATIAAPDAVPTVVALLPGRDRPRLRPGMTIQIKLPGYEKAHERAVVGSVGREVIGPGEARRYVGAQIADAIKIKGPVVIVRAQLESRTFVARDKTYSFSDGMTAKAEVAVRTRRVLVALLPALERLL